MRRAAVHRHHARADPPGHGHGPLEGARVDRTGQPVTTLVGDPDRVVVILKRNHDQHRSEDLFARDGHLVVHIDEERRLHVVAAVELLGPTSAKGELGPLGQALVDVAEHTVALLCGDQRSHHHVVPLRISVGRHVEHAHKLFDGVVVACPRHEHAGRDATALARVKADRQAPHEGRVQVGVVKHDVGGLAPEFQEGSLQGRGALFHDSLTDGGGAGKRDQVHVGRQREVFPEQMVRRGDDVDHAGGYIGLVGDHPPEQGGIPRRVRSRLEHHGVACRKGLGKLVDRHFKGEIPGHDGTDDAHRLPPDAARVDLPLVALPVRHLHFPLELVHELEGVLERARERHIQLLARGRHARTARLQDQLFAQLLALRLQPRLQLGQAMLAKCQVRGPPTRVESAPSSRDRTLHVGPGCVGHFADLLLRRGVDIVEGGAAFRRHEFAVDEHAGLRIHLDGDRPGPRRRLSRATATAHAA